MEIRYSLTLDDYLAFLRYKEVTEAQERRSTPKLIAYLLVLFFAAISSFGLLFGDDKVRSELAGPSAVIVLGGLLAVGYGRFLRKRARQRQIQEFKYDLEKGHWGGLLFRISPERMTFATELTEESLAWPLIAIIAETEELLIFISAQNNAYLVPRRAFPATAAFLAFADLVKCYHKEAGTPQHSNGG